ncbi:RNA deprotection pyrophosphohydrolase [Bacillus sp. 03113]|uniref:RNA deprotection pyrophosphohydrolase n=1 Tax=Bacillus sp. 03113 TaxID=2578211 RepID=UPI001143F198|nr:nucleoside triphosphatase YtkD [Bacillus sp. 03113]
MELFYDTRGATVRLSFQQNAFPEKPKHVIVICRLKDEWLLTNHKIRGWEFPGGKIEAGESLEAAAIREVKEETGALLKSLVYIGEYEVNDQTSTFVKAVFFGIIEKLQPLSFYFETNGPIFVKGNIIDLRWEKQYSFIMKDKVMEKCIKVIENMKNTLDEI